MKKYLTIATLAALTLVACNKKEFNPAQGGSTTSLTISVPSDAVKTYLGSENVSGVHKSTWSAGDCVSVNGTVSDALAAGNDGSAAAVFNFPSAVSAPYKVLYPASSANDNTLTIPATEQLPIGRFNAPLYGSAASGDHVALKSLGAALHFGFTCQAEKTVNITKVQLVSAGGESISGDYTLEVANGLFTGNGSFTANASDCLERTYTDAALSAASPLYVNIPVVGAVYSEGFTLRVYAAEEYMTLRFFTGGKTVESTKSYDFPVMIFTPGVDCAVVCAGEFESEEIEFDGNKLSINATFPEPQELSLRASLVESSSTGVSDIFISEKPKGDGTALKFNFAFEPADGNAPYIYTSVYPSSAMTLDGTKATVAVPAVQTYTAIAADRKAAAYYAVSAEQAARPSSLDLSYTGISGVLKVNFAGIPAGEVVRNVAVTSTSGQLAGSKSINLSSGVVSADYSATAATINAAPASDAADASVAWFRTLPVAAGKYNITLVTDKSIFKWNGVSVEAIACGSQTELSLNISSAVKQNELRIFLIGNSFTQDACHQLPGVLCGFAPAIGPDGFKVTVCQCYYGGRTVPEYNTGWETSSDYTRHLAEPGVSAMVNTSNQNLKTVAESGRWDIVTIQEHTGNYRAWDWNSTEKRHFEELIEKVAATQEVRPQFYYIYSQTYYNEAKIGSGSVPYICWKDQAGMFDVTSDFAKHVVDELPFVDVIATGTTLQNMRQTSLMNSMCLTRDGYHMDYGISRYGAACCCYLKMIYPRCGEIPLSKNTYRSNDINTSDGSYRTPITDANVPIAQQAAIDAAASPWAVTYQSHSYGPEGSAGSNPGTVDQGAI